MDYPVATSLVYCIDKEKNVISIVESEGDEYLNIGPFIDASYDDDAYEYILTFRCEDGILAEARIDVDEAHGMTYAELGRWLAESGYPMAPGLAYFMGLFLHNWLGQATS